MVSDAYKKIRDILTNYVDTTRTMVALNKYCDNIGKTPDNLDEKDLPYLVDNIEADGLFTKLSPGKLKHVKKDLAELVKTDEKKEYLIK